MIPVLKDLFNNYEILLEHTFSSNPSIIDMDNISNKYKDESIDIIIGIGGGSAMDVAKIACVSIPARRNKYKIDDLLLQNELLRNLNAIECIQITTTAGTGSECTPFATIWDYENQEKKSLSHPKMFAKKAFIDPDFLINMPLNIALSTGLDSLNQAI